MRGRMVPLLSARFWKKDHESDGSLHRRTRSNARFGGKGSATGDRTLGPQHRQHTLLSTAATISLSFIPPREMKIFRLVSIRPICAGVERGRFSSALRNYAPPCLAIV